MSSSGWPRWRRVVLGRLIERRVADGPFGEEEQESGSRRKPITGEMRSTWKTFAGLRPVHAEVPLKELMILLATPTPMMEADHGCRLEAGDKPPGAQVPRKAAMRSANTMEYPAPELTLRMSSTGSKVMTLKAPHRRT